MKVYIKSFEISDESPDAKLVLYEKGMVPEEDPLFEFDLKIDKDELEEELKIQFEFEKIKRYIDYKSIDVYPLIKIKDIVYSSNTLSFLNIQMGDVNYE